jgi:taurine--2-oxoglutarate transaminase
MSLPCWRGFYTYHHENSIIVAPPLIITEEELREAMKIMDEVLGEVDGSIAALPKKQG